MMEEVECVESHWQSNEENIASQSCRRRLAAMEREDVGGSMLGMARRLTDESPSVERGEVGGRMIKLKFVEEGKLR